MIFKKSFTGWEPKPAKWLLKAISKSWTLVSAFCIFLNSCTVGHFYCLILYDFTKIFFIYTFISNKSSVNLMGCYYCMVGNSSLTVQTSEMLGSFKKSYILSLNHEECLTSSAYLNLVSRFRVIVCNDSNPFFIDRYGGSWISNNNVSSIRGSKVKKTDNSLETFSSFFSN